MYKYEKTFTYLFIIENTNIRFELCFKLNSVKNHYVRVEKSSTKYCRKSAYALRNSVNTLNYKYIHTVKQCIYAISECIIMHYFDNARLHTLKSLQNLKCSHRYNIANC